MFSDLILQENLKSGTPATIWDAHTSSKIEGFATEISVNHGSTVSFKINVNTGAGARVPFHIEIYRLGYYGGDGATLVKTIDGLRGAAQPNPTVDATTGLVDAGNWTVSASWATPANAVSGVYLAKIVRDDTGTSNQIPFIVRADETRADGSKSDIVFQTSDTTWEAYNGWGGNNGKVGANFYGGHVSHPPVPDPGLGSQSRAYAVSYDRPLITRDGTAQNYLFGAEYAGIYWLEKNGYDVSYIAGVDTDRLGINTLLGHKIYLSVGHDEYWSGDQRANVTAARDLGVNLAFLSGNEVYWKTRYQASTASTDGSPTDYRTLVCYKETWANRDPNAPPSAYANIDPSNQWTGTWRDARFATSTDANGNLVAIGGGNLENGLTGQLFAADGDGQFGPGIDVPAQDSQFRLWRNTRVAANGGATEIAPGLLGYEFDAAPNNQFTPPNLIKLSNTTVQWKAVLVDQGNSTPPGTVTHNLTLYKAPSGALVFGAGTVFWTWGLSDQHDSSPYPYSAHIANATIQQATLNLLADMGVEPGVSDAVLARQGLLPATRSTDHFAPIASFAIAGNPSSVKAGDRVTITGTANDHDGSPGGVDGQVAAVQVSTDGGETWSVATGTTNWTYDWTAQGAGDHMILARAIDDSLNVRSTESLQSASLTVMLPVSPSYVGSGAAGHWNLGGAEEAGIAVAVTDGTRRRSMTAAGVTTDNNTAIGDFTVAATDASGNVSAPSGGNFERAAGRGTFSFALKAALSAAALIALVSLAVVIW